MCPQKRCPIKTSHQSDLSPFEIIFLTVCELGPAEPSEKPEQGEREGEGERHLFM